MPELPEVETLVFDLKRLLEDCTIASVEIRDELILKTPRLELETELPGKRVLHIGRRGKYLRFELSGGWILWFHLGMTGQLFLEEVPPVEGHVHFILSFTDFKNRLFYRDVRRFGRIALTSPEADPVSQDFRLGPEPKEWKKDAFASLLRARRARIKNLLLDQRLIAGLGNIYADESLHRAGIHPLRRAHRIPRRRLFLLHDAICEVLDEAIRCGGSSIDDYVHLDGRPGRFQEFHRVYGRGGEQCLTCGALIRKVKLSGRTSSFCPQCQT